tara:strand:+ start:56445 stop:57545 length:1101 start_codon:yes stop_codon:yes gene_type:complete
LGTYPDVDFAVIGAGVAGLAIARSLIQKGKSVCLVDTRDIAAGASGTPLGLINPATGRYGSKVWEAENCLNAVAKDLQEVQSSAPNRFYKNTGILRPAQDEKMVRRMRENVDKNDWPEGWCSWLDEAEVKDINPNLNCMGGAMWLPKGLTVNVGEYLKAKAKFLTHKGLSVKTGRQYELSLDKGQPIFKFDDGDTIHANSVVFAAGYETSTSKYWAFLPLHSIKGQVATFTSPEADNFDYSLSALGYIASISDSRFIAGSTYEHHFDDLEPDKEGLKYLKNRLGGVYPALFEKARLISQWAGVRASTPNRKPFLGQHPEIKNFYVFTGLGSKGLMYSEYMGNLLCEHILDEKRIPENLNVDRIEPQ